MSDDEAGEDWEQGDLLAEANNLNAAIKQHLGDNENRPAVLEKYKTDILGYMGEIGQAEFAPRDDRLTKEGIEKDLRVNLKVIDALLRSGVGKSKRRRSNKRSNKRSKSKRSSRRKRSKRSKSH